MQIQSRPVKVPTRQGLRLRQKRALEALVTQWGPICADLQARAYASVRCTLSELSHDSAFLGFKVDTKMQNARGRTSTWRAVVVEGGSTGTFKYKYSDGTEIDVNRSEVLADIGASIDVSLGDSEEYALLLQASNYAPIWFWLLYMVCWICKWCSLKSHCCSKAAQLGRTTGQARIDVF